MTGDRPDASGFRPDAPEHRPVRPGASGDAPGRLLAPDEADRILARAARREVAAPDPGTALTVDDLASAAAQAGLDPADVRRAALVAPPPRVPALSGIAFGAPARRRVTAHVPGASIPDERQALVRAAERGLGRSGQVVDSAPGRFLWREDHTLGRSTVELDASDSGVDVRVTTDRTGVYTLGWFLALIVVAVAAAVIPGVAVGVLGTVLGLVVLPFVGVRPLWVRSDREVLGRLEDTIMDVLRVVEEESRRDALAAGDGDGPD